MPKCHSHGRCSSPIPTPPLRNSIMYRIDATTAGPISETATPTIMSTNHRPRKPASSFFSFGSTVCPVCGCAGAANRVAVIVNLPARKFSTSPSPAP
jgi:hypothetical protein